MTLSDINMPGMDGLTLLREIKVRQPDLRVMMVTAYGDDERRRVAEEYGAAQFITKPVDFELLKAQLRYCPMRRIKGRNLDRRSLLAFRVALAMSATGHGQAPCEAEGNDC